MRFLEHFSKHNLPHPNCIAYKDGHTEHFHLHAVMADQATTSPGTPGVDINPTNLMGKINKTIITYSLQNSSGDIADTEKEAIAVSLGVTQWGVRLGVKFQKVPNGQAADVPITFLKPGDPLYAGLFPDDNILAVTYYPLAGNGNFQSHMYFNDDFRVIWSIDGKAMPCPQAQASGHATGCTSPDEMLETYKLTRVFRHEFGHALGMMHFPQSPTDSMYPYYNATDKLGPDEIALAQSAYGMRSPPVPQTYIDSIDNIVAVES